MRTLIALLLLAAAPAGAQTLVIGNKGEDTVSFVDLATGRERARVPTARMPHEVAISPDGRRAAVVAYGGSTVDLFDVATARRLERIDLGANRRPHGLVWLSDDRLIATCEGSDTLVVVRAAPEGDGPRVRAFPTGGKGSHMVVVGPHRRVAYVANMGSGTVSLVDIDGRSATDTIAVGGVPEGLALSPDGRRLWVADRDGATVRAFDTRTQRSLGAVSVGRTPIRVLVTPDGKHVLTSNYADGTVSVVDARTRRVVRTIRISGEAKAAQVTMLFGPGGRLFVAETGTDTIAEVDLASSRILRRLPAGDAGDGLGYSRVEGAR